LDAVSAVPSQVQKNRDMTQRHKHKKKQKKKRRQRKKQRKNKQKVIPSTPLAPPPNGSHSVHHLTLMNNGSNHLVFRKDVHRIEKDHPIHFLSRHAGAIATAAVVGAGLAHYGYEKMGSKKKVPSVPTTHKPNMAKTLLGIGGGILGLAAVKKALDWQNKKLMLESQKHKKSVETQDNNGTGKVEIGKKTAENELNNLISDPESKIKCKEEPNGTGKVEIGKKTAENELNNLISDPESKIKCKEEPNGTGNVEIGKKTAEDEHNDLISDPESKIKCKEEPNGTGKVEIGKKTVENEHSPRSEEALVPLTDKAVNKDENNLLEPKIVSATTNDGTAIAGEKSSKHYIVKCQTGNGVTIDEETLKKNPHFAHMLDNHKVLESGEIIISVSVCNESTLKFVSLIDV
jgi:hypothetical protein